MKRFFTILLGTLIAVLIVSTADAQKKDEIKVKITKEIDGETKTLEKTYSSEEEMKADPEFREMTGENEFYFNFSGAGTNAMIEIEELKRHAEEMAKEGKRAYSFHFSDEEEGEPNVFFFGENGEGEFLQEFHEDFQWEMEEHKEMIHEQMKKIKEELENINEEELKEEMKKLEDLLKEQHTKSFHIRIDKRVRVEDVDGDEFGKKGRVSDSNLLELDGLNFFPNPSDGRFRLRFKVPSEGPLDIKVFSLDGKEVYSRSFERFGGIYSEAVDLSDEEKGIYLMEISQGKKRLTKKIAISE